MDNLDVQTSSQNTEEFEVANCNPQDLSEQTIRPLQLNSLFPITSAVSKRAGAAINY